MPSTTRLSAEPTSSKHEVARRFFEGRRDSGGPLISSDHFTVDRTLIRKLGLKGFRPKDRKGNGQTDGDRNTTVDFRGERQERRYPRVELRTPGSMRKSMGRRPEAASPGHV